MVFGAALEEAGVEHLGQRVAGVDGGFGREIERVDAAAAAGCVRVCECEGCVRRRRQDEGCVRDGDDDDEGCVRDDDDDDEGCVRDDDDDDDEGCVRRRRS